MNEEIDEYDLYHQDFTTVSNWEVFIARIEEILLDWRLSKTKTTKYDNNENTKKWLSKSEELSFEGLNFTLSYHYKDEECTNEVSEENKPSLKQTSSQLLSGIWESTKKFMEESDGSPHPVSNWYGLKEYIMLSPHAPLVNENLIKIVLSSVNIAFANVECCAPFFLKVREHWQQCYLGIYEDAEFRTNFDTIHLKRIPSQCSHLNGLANLFKGRIASPEALEPIQISAMFSYDLKDLEAFSWKRSNTNEFLSVDGFDVEKLMKLPFGCEKNPIKSAMLNVIWPRFLENAVIDSGTYSDFDPVMAPTWMITLKMRDDLTCLLSDTIMTFMDLLDNNNLLMDTLGLSRSLGIVNPLNKITEAPITISKLVKAAMGSQSSSDFKGPIADELLMPLLYYIFPDAINDDKFKYVNIEVELKQGNTEPKLCSYVKASPENGLVWRLSVAAVRLYDAGGSPYLAHLWYEFVQELQYRWEHLILVPGVADGDPNGRTCLLHQKLQLLNCCINRAKTNAEGTSSSEEFYDCSEDESDEQQPSSERGAGRLRPLEGAKLKNGALLYIPRTQDPAPKTEDQLEEDTELMVRLGEDARASELRARMMSASLLSDMEAFKAANPGAELCDFVQWYSPRDWRSDEGGQLGDRMLLPGNPWVEAWSVARSLPAARQRRLFDAAREAERVLHYLRSRTVCATAELLLPDALRAAAARASVEGASLGARCAAPGGELRRQLEAGARDVCAAEREWCRAAASRRILSDAAVGAALGADGRARVLAASGGALPPAARREFSLRVRDQLAPQLLRAALSTHMVLVSAFTERTVLL